MSRTALIYCEEAIQHNTGGYHPESPLRMKALRLAFEESGLNLPVLQPDPASRDDLLRIHTRAHVDTVEACCLNGGHYPDPDTVMGPGSWDAALLSAGAGITACKAVLDGQYENAFIMMRPPGHHAEPDHAMGFCLFNNIAVTARWLRETGKARRVAILDFDVHHGNGTQDAFYHDETVFYVSLHEYPHFPGTGFPYERGKDNTTLNIQMPPGCSPEQWTRTIEGMAAPQLELFAPDFLLLSSGFDGHRLDPLGNQLLEAADYGAMTRLVRHIAGGRIVSFLEGGYHLTALGQCAVSHVSALME